MKTKEMIQEQVSALVDGELSAAFIDTTLASLRQEKNRMAWDVYHQIGDVLRSDDMAFNLSVNFSARIMVRLEQEPPMIAVPRAKSQLGIVHSAQKVMSGNSGRAMKAHKQLIRRFGLSGMVAVAVVAAVTFVVLPQMIEEKTVLSASSKSQLVLASASGVHGRNSGSDQAVSYAGVMEILRDPDIDEYLQAHQRFSPVLYGTVQHPRSTILTADN